MSDSPGKRSVGVIVLIGLTLLGCSTPQRLTPGQLFSGPLVDIRSPASPGWQLISSAGEMTFAREDASTGNTYVAQVSAFDMPPFRTGDELVAIVKAGFAKDTSPDRFKVVDDEFRLTDERPYPCVRLRGTYEDLKARTRRGTVALPLHIRSLYCQHPARSDMGLHMTYSQRGGPPDPDLDSQAQSFFEGVQVSRGGGR